ncbi:alpha/beta fold hydrolase [Flavobacterium jejuense]|uniref:Alpha/beta fold hydrolase n=1 Tax=Flavobacterium jejuense TaxID=1544455 RepID=A0ABX0IKE7_9FLAO|nr:alpha/beta fold hydrolase [Flavobacterium jejuense]NHN24063.1 alpha/beta fold hydrolase [Flavobacterium jejuense]
MKPETKYTKSGEINIAYQVFGSGSIDLVYIPGWVSNIDLMWACPELVSFLVELGKIARVILFDKRGTGLSDRVVDFSTLEERMDDIRAVMDIVDSKRAVLFGHSEGGSASALFAATYPDRTISLITFGIFAKRMRAPNYPWAPSTEERQRLYDMIENSWCGGEMQLETLVPSKATDKDFMNWLASYFRSGASPTAAMKLTKMNTEVDIIDILGYIKVPTLLMQRTHDIDVKIEEGKFIAKHIKNSKFVELDGDDHLFWVGNTHEVLEEMKDFIRNTKADEYTKKGLLTVLFGQIVSSLKSNFKLDMIIEFVTTFGGSIIHKDKNCFAVAFEVSSKAVNCSTDLLKALQDLEISVAMGIYIKEGFHEGDKCLDEKDNHMVTSILSQLNPNQILVTQTVKHLLSGSGFDFTQDTSILDFKSNNLCKLYDVTKKSKLNNQNDTAKPYVFCSYDSFLEDALQIIDEHLENDGFGVEMLSREMRLGQRQLQRKIKETTNKSPNQLITSIRLKKAKEALLTYNYTVSEIAFQFGFTSPSYFSKCFKKEYGICPTSVLQKFENKIESLQFMMS